MLSLVFFGHSTEFVIPTTHQLQAENRKSHPAVVVLTLDISFELQYKSILFAENSV